LPLARTPEGRAFAAASTAACLIRSGELTRVQSRCARSISKPVISRHFFAGANNTSILQGFEVPGML